MRHRFRLQAYRHGEGKTRFDHDFCFAGGQRCCGRITIVPTLWSGLAVFLRRHTAFNARCQPDNNVKCCNLFHTVPAWYRSGHPCYFRYFAGFAPPAPSRFSRTLLFEYESYCMCRCFSSVDLTNGGLTCDLSLALAFRAEPCTGFTSQDLKFVFVLPSRVLSSPTPSSRRVSSMSLSGTFGVS